MTHSEKISKLLEKGILISPEELDKVESNVEKSTQNITSINNDAKVKIVYSYNKSPKKRVVTDFFKFFNHRFKALEKIIRTRPEMQGLVSINKLKFKEERENVSIIGMIKEKSLTKNKNIILVLEDLTGQTSVLIHKNNNEAYTVGKDLVLDEVIGVIGSAGKNIVFSNKVLFPDVPMNKEFKKAPVESYAVFLGDFHFGSKVFLQKEFDKFLAWINGAMGNEEQKEIANKVKYIFFAGDLVEGVGVYPGQEEDLEIKDIKKQYAILSKSLSKIGSDKKLIICPGNHDAGRIAEPQPPLYNDFAEALWQLPNAVIVSNPAMINIGSTEDFSGLDVLLYHGYSLIYYANNVESIRTAGGQKRVDLIMKFLLQKRHLAPTHESNMYIPDAEEDPLVIDKIPDIFVTGHIHRASASEYRNITLLNTSCWSDITEDQEKRGLEPQPGRIFVMNLQTRKVKLINFYGR